MKQDAVVFGFIFHQTAATRKHAVCFKKALTKLAKSLEGNIYLTFSHEATREEMIALYPSTKEFLQKKKQYDPEELFSSEFYSRLNLINYKTGVTVQQIPS